jgi:hypothetical protein
MRRSTIITLCATVSVLLLLMACSGGGGSSNISSQSSNTGTITAIVSDDASQDWATVGVKVLSIALMPQGGGTPVTIYSAPSSGAPFINLVQLDQLGEIIGNSSPIPTGTTFTQAVITVSGNPSDIQLISAPDPEPGFPLAGGTPVPSGQIQVVGASGSPSTVPVTVTLSPPLTVAAGSSNPLDLEFDLSHPAFIVDHVAPAGTFWAVNFNPQTVRHHPIHDITRLVLRRLYGTVSSVSSDNTYITVNKVLPTVPVVTPETSTATSLNLQILADPTVGGGTIFRDLDLGTRFVINDFSSVAATLPNKFVRIQARYQQSGSLVATRIWASTSFAKVYVSGEGHVLDVGASSFTVVNEDGTTSTIPVDANTNFYFQNETTAIGAGTSFLGAPNFVRGFKVLYNSQDDSVIIEIARFSGAIQSPTTQNFIYKRTFDVAHTNDNYTVTLPYISSSTANGEDNSGNAITGFKWWYFAQPTSTLQSGSGAISSFFSAVGGTVNYGATCVPVGFPAALGISQPVVGESYANWNDPAASNTWSAFWTVLLPTPAPLATVKTAASGSSFTMTPVSPSCTGTTVNVDLDTTPGQATLVYTVSRSGNIITVTPLGDISQAGVLTTLDGALGVGTPVKVFGVPESNGNLKAYVLFYFTGTAPTQ